MKEKDFEREFSKVAALNGMKFVKIPDAIKTAASLIQSGSGFTMVEHKRPADGVLVTQFGLVLVELKVQSGQAKDHQIKNCLSCNLVRPGSYVFVRAKDTKRGVRYTIETANAKLGLEVVETCQTWAELFMRLRMIAQATLGLNKLQKMMEVRP
jgi:hypothetical protein